MVIGKPTMMMGPYSLEVLTEEENETVTLSIFQITDQCGDQCQESTKTV